MPAFRVSLLTGGADKPYALGLLEALISKGAYVEFVAGDDMSMSKLLAHPNVDFYNIRGDQDPAASRLAKIARILQYYLRLIKYVSTTDSRIFHILWLNKFLLFDRTALLFYYRLLGKRIVFTAHNIDERERDGGNNLINRASLKLFYHCVHHIFVHSTKMKSQLVDDFHVRENNISVIPFGINNTLPRSGLTSTAAKAKLDLTNREKVILFFGNIAPYKGLDYAVSALDRLIRADQTYRLVIAGPLKACPEYWEKIEIRIRRLDLDRYILKRIRFIPEEDVEVFFMAADVLILPYKFIYQSGVLFLSYSFGLPVVATDVGSLREDIIEGKTGMICDPEDPEDIAATIHRYFESALFRNLSTIRKDITDFGNSKYSWNTIGDITSAIYRALAERL